jgi:hypothetical protein
VAITKYDNKAMSAPNRKMVTAGKRYWLTKDGKLVLDGDPRKYSLYAHPHHRVPEDELYALLAASDITSGSKAEPEESPSPKPRPKKKRASKKASSKKAKTDAE